MLEIVWTATPTVLFLSCSISGWTNFDYDRQLPRDAMVINVTARQWAYHSPTRTGNRHTAVPGAHKPAKMNSIRSM